MVHLLITHCPLTNSMPCWLRCTLLIAWRPSSCSATSLVIRHPAVGRTLSWMPGARCPSTHSKYSLLPGVLVVTRHSQVTLSHPGYSMPFGVLLVTRRFSVCSSHLSRRYPQWPSWSLLSLLAARHHRSGYYVLGTYLIVWRSPGCSEKSWLLATMLTSLHPHG